MAIATHKWSPPASPVVLLASELNNLANNARALGTTIIPNATDRHMFVFFILQVQFTAAPTDQSQIQLYLLPTFDGTTYTDGSDTVAPSLEALVTSFTLKATTTTVQRIPAPGVLIHPVNYKPLIVNLSGQAFPASGSSLQMIKYGHESSS